MILSDSDNTVIFSDTLIATGVDGKITVDSGTVNIEDIYEDDVVTGVTTKRGTDKGLNHGAGTYDPENGAYIQASNFTISSGATLTHGTAYGDGSSNKNGIIWIACLVNFINEGTIDISELGREGGIGGPAISGDPSFRTGNGGPGGSNTSGILGDAGNKDNTVSTGGAGGAAYGSSSIPTTTWGHLYGSGGGGGGGFDGTVIDGLGSGGGGGGCAEAGTAGVNGIINPGYNGAEVGAAGGKGAGAIRIYALFIDVSSGTMVATGENAALARTDAGGAGGGSGGTIYIEAARSAILGTDTLSAAGGSGSSSTHAGNGGAGSVGRIHIEGTYTGSTSNPAIA